MEVRTQGKIHQARVTTDNDRHKWELRIFNPDGTIAVSAFTRDEIALAGIQITKSTSGEWAALQRAGFQPPFRVD